MQTLQETVEKYYQFRKYVQPDQIQALLFFLTEVGETCEAFLCRALSDSLTIGENEKIILQQAINTGHYADQIVDIQAGWVRNSDRLRKQCLKDEIGDTQMMLTVFALILGIDPVGAMLDKMEKKGFVQESPVENLE